MTLLPVEAKRIERAPKTFPEINDFADECSNPYCNNKAADKHHIVRRSYAGENDWVYIDGQLVPNVCVLCRPCHELVSTNKAQIVWNHHVYLWSDDHHDGATLLNPQVPGLPEVFSEPKIFSPENDGSVCPTCDRPFPKPREQTEERRERRTWTVTVPKDKREDGAEVLDTLLEEIRLELASSGLHYGAEMKVRYFVLSTALGLFLTNSKEILDQQ